MNRSEPPSQVSIELGSATSAEGSHTQIPGVGTKDRPMKVLFFCLDSARLELMILTLRFRWPDVKALVASQGSEGLLMIEQEEPALVMLCEDLPDMGIWASIREIRQFADTPIIVAAEGGGEMEVLKALELGADEYISMPCSMMVVLARVVALLRRVGLSNKQSYEGPIRCGELVIDPANYEVYLGNRRLVLTPTEFKLLYLLGKNRHMTLSQEFIRRGIWSDEVESGDTLKKYVQRLRRKLGDDARNPTWIKTIHGLGYRLTTPAVSTSR